MVRRGLIMPTMTRSEAIRLLETTWETFMNDRCGSQADRDSATEELDDVMTALGVTSEERVAAWDEVMPSTIPPEARSDIPGIPLGTYGTFGPIPLDQILHHPSRRPT